MSSSSKISKAEEKNTMAAPKSNAPLTKKTMSEFKIPSPKTKPVSSVKARSSASLRGAATGSSKAPASRPKAQRKAPTESEVDDDGSIAESLISTNRVRRTEVERIAYFENQSECGTVEPHRVNCTRCRKWVSLGKKQTYAVKPWEKHREKCDAQPKYEDSDPISAGSVVHGSKKTEAERKAELEADTRALKVEPHRQQCKRCTAWIETNNLKLPYSLYNWERHQAKCSTPAAPSARVAMAERKVRLTNDSQAKTHSPRHVDCKICGANITLPGAEYNLDAWETHKVECPPPADQSVSGATDATLVQPSIAERAKSSSPLKSAEPEASSSSAVQAPSRKRRRDEDDVSDDDERLAVKARDEKYEEPKAEPPRGPGIVGWFMQPLNAFYDGLTSGLK
ncbi:hypothetical protein CYLTODRAFT_408791 [Cylindrobasidium torrendii FP15055 ss-10]|uniref:Uncharacterized protein n=1 Tax=Cylindrobasidium torrendii FP15055 ss-10 TaxID=1314674 RepID=A0A0D7BJ28_9AGAR|nr:hypothetical protein CYLTODRAFT_408791 [Cylindrobasidium torrendii FP15055 ss-10]